MRMVCCKGLGSVYRPLSLSTVLGKDCHTCVRVTAYGQGVIIYTNKSGQVKNKLPRVNLI